MKIDFEKANGLIPVIIQDYKTNQVLMLGFMNQEAYEKTLETKKIHFYSRSRKSLWLKGETSNNFLILKEMFLDCDNDSLLIKAQQVGSGTCHTGRVSCFYQKYHEKSKEWQIIN